MCNDASRSSARSVAMAVGLVATAATIAVVSYLYWWRVRSLRTEPLSLLSVADILAECHNKMREIHANLEAVPESGEAPA